jgi:hypothetical protein
MKYVPRGRQLLYKESKRDVSQRTVFETRALNPDRNFLIPPDFVVGGMKAEK